MKTYSMKIRCSVCNGTGAVSTIFASGYVDTGRGYTGTEISKPCPVCSGTGIQTVTVNEFSHNQITLKNEDGSEWQAFVTFGNSK